MTLPTVTAMTPDDLDEIISLERRCFSDPWTRRMYLTDLTENELATYLVARLTHPAPASPTEAVDALDAGRATVCNTGATLPSRGPASVIVGYGGFWLMVDEAHIATIATHPDWRGCGLGLWLMLGLLDAAVARGAVLATLEVRAGNLPAQQLYHKLGFEIAGYRAHYYRDGEGGLIMTTPPLTSPAMRERLGVAKADGVARLKKRLAPLP